MRYHTSGTVERHLVFLCTLMTTLAPIGQAAAKRSTVPAAENRVQFALPDLDGNEFSLEKELGTGPLVFDFWATWCKPCIKALPKLQAVARDYKEGGVRVYAISIDGPQSQAKIRPFMRRYKLELPVLLDRASQVMKQFQLLQVPSTLIISTSGEVVFRHQGYRPGDEKKLRNHLDELLRKKEG